MFSTLWSAPGLGVDSVDFVGIVRILVLLPDRGGGADATEPDGTCLEVLHDGERGQQN